MSYIRESLSDGESVQEIFALHWLSYTPVMFWCFMAIVAFTLKYAGLGMNIVLLLSGSCLLIGLIEYFKLRSLEQGVTNRRVILKKGIIARSTEEMKLSSIETVEIKQTIPGRILNYGHVFVTGRGISDVVFRNIDEPLHVKKVIENAGS